MMIGKNNDAVGGVRTTYQCMYYKWLRCSFESNESFCNVGEMAAEGVGSYRLPVVSVGIEWLQDGEGWLVGGWVDGHSR